MDNVVSLRTETGRRSWLLWICSAILFLLAAAYLSRGFRFLLVSPQPSDLYQRWQETRRVLAGRNPYLQEPWASPYPPSSFVSLLPFVWPPRHFVQPYFAMINAICIAGMAMWAASVGNRTRAGTPGKVLLAASTLAIASLCTTLGIGQTGIVVTALVLASMLLAERQKDYLAGLVFGIALLKPTIAGLFIFPLLFQKRWALFITASFYMLITTAIVLAHVRTSPQDVLHIWRAMSDTGGLDQGSGGLIDVIKQFGLGTKTAMTLIGAVAFLTTVGTCWVFRGSPLIVTFAIAAVGGRLWSYHSQYDNVMLVFLLITLGVAVLRTATMPLIAAFVAVGVSLWIPARLGDRGPAQLIQVPVWIGALIVLLVSTRDEAKSTASTTMFATAATEI